MGLLDGIKVVETTSFISGPLSTTMLADLGAEVVRVEPTPDGDGFRRFGRLENGLSIAYVNCNRGKDTRMLDLKDPAGIDELHGLLADADAFVTNWRPGVAERMGLTDEALRERYPRLVWVKISGFGQTGPLASQPAFDGVLQARSGIGFTQGTPDEPKLIRSYFADKVTAMLAAQAVMAAIISRDRTGIGSIIDVPMIDAVAYFNFPDTMVERTLLGSPGATSYNRQLQAVRPIRTSDGWVLVSPVGGKQVKAAMQATGQLESLATLKTISDPVVVAETIYELLEQATQSQSTEHWLQAFEAADVPAAPVLDFDAHLADPQVVHNRTYVEVDHPTMGRIRVPRHPARVTS